MTTFIQDELDLKSGEQSVQAVMDRNAILVAILMAAAEHAVFSVADVRPHLGRDVRPSSIGATFSGLVKEGRLIRVGVGESGNSASRNAHKLVRTYRLGNW